MTTTEERALLEQELRHGLRLLQSVSADMASTLERLRQLREADEPTPRTRLVVEDGPCGRPEVVR